MNSDQGAQIQPESYKQRIEEPVFPSSLAFITGLATDVLRFKSTQVLFRAIRRIIPSLCPPQWNGSENIAETCLKCPFHLGYLILGDDTVCHVQVRRNRMVCYSVCCCNASG